MGSAVSPEQHSGHSSNPAKSGNSLRLFKGKSTFNFLLGIALSFGFGYAISHLNDSSKIPVRPLEKETQFLIAISVSGAFGGLLYALQTGKLQLPYTIENTASNSVSNQAFIDNSNLTTSKDESLKLSEPINGRSLSLGCISDCLIGIGGAFAVFLLVPNSDTLVKANDADIHPLDIELLATTIVGGYGGRFLLDRAVNNIGRRVAETEEKLNQSIGQIQKVEQEVGRLDEIEAKVKRLLSRYLDKSLGLLPEQLDELKQSIAKASSATRTDIFGIAQRVLYDNRGRSNVPIDKALAEKVAKVLEAAQNRLPVDSSTTNNTLAEIVKLTASMPGDVILVERTLEVFKALKETDTNSNHRYAAHIAYAYMALEAWQDAIQALNEAIQQRDKDPQNQSDRGKFWVYECNRAICRIQLNQSEQNSKLVEELTQFVLQDLHVVRESLQKSKMSLKDIEQFIEGSKAIIQNWVDLQQIDLETLKPINQ